MSIYPYLFFNEDLNHKPVFKGLSGIPFILDLSEHSSAMEGLSPREQEAFQEKLDKMMSPHFTWGVASYLENRKTLLMDCPQMVSERRFFHLGIDIIVPVKTPLYAPLDASVEDVGYEEGEGNYGGYTLLKHENKSFETFYSLYGHLRKATLPEKGRTFTAGEQFGTIGDFHENGNWFYHTHIQVITKKGLDRGFLNKGYCTHEDLAEMDSLCPSPLPLFITQEK